MNSEETGENIFTHNSLHSLRIIFKSSKIYYNFEKTGVFVCFLREIIIAFENYF